MGEVKKVDLTAVMPYGDTMNDGKVQMSFSLPVPQGPEADEAAKQLMRQMGLKDPSVVFSKDLGIGYTFFVAYGSATQTVDYTKIVVPKVDTDVMDMTGCEEYIAEHIKRPVVIVGACTGTDAHTVGIDAIMNMKGYNHHFGLERYEGVEAYNLGSQVPNEELLAKAIELKADAILSSQIVTQKDVHIPNLSQLVELCEAEGVRDKIILCCGGPRINHELAKELGYDAGFGPGTYADDVASFVIQEMVKRKLV